MGTPHDPHDRRSRAHGHRRNAILDAIATMTAEMLTGRGFALRAPVGAEFCSAADGGTGVEVSVKLADPAAADAARAALRDHFGGARPPDVIKVG